MLKTFEGEPMTNCERLVMKVRNLRELLKGQEKRLTAQHDLIRLQREKVSELELALSIKEQECNQIVKKWVKSSHKLTSEERLIFKETEIAKANNQLCETLSARNKSIKQLEKDKEDLIIKLIAKKG